MHILISNRNPYRLNVQLYSGIFLTCSHCLIQNVASLNSKAEITGFIYLPIIKDGRDSRKDRKRCLTTIFRSILNKNSRVIFQGVMAAVFLSVCSRHKPYTEIDATEDLRIPLTDSERSRSGSHRHVRGQGVPIDRPSGMNSLIVCNSYSNRAGAWSRASYSGRYSHSYGSIETKRYLELTTWWL